MRSKLIVTAVLVAGGLAFSEAKAERIRADSAAATSAFKACTSGGSHIVMQEPAGVRSCINRDGSGIVCGGKTAEQKRTCDTFRRAKDKPWTLTVTEAARYEGALSKGTAAQTGK